MSQQALSQDLGSQRADGGALSSDAPPAASQPPPTQQAPQITQPATKGWRFWAIFPPLSIATFLVGLDSTVISSALPLITLDLHTGDNYVWVINGYLLTSCVEPFPQPLKS